VTFQWELSERDGVAVLSLRGQLEEPASRRFVAALGWACTHSTGPLVLDLSRLGSWSAGGRSAIDGAVSGWQRDGRKVAVCLPADGPQEWGVTGPAEFADLPAAVGAARAAGQETT
jgi:hypothetical protein